MTTEGRSSGWVEGEGEVVVVVVEEGSDHE